MADESDNQGESPSAADADLIAVRVKALRKALGMTQEVLAARAGSDWKRLHITMLESGRNQATSWHHRVGLSRGFGLSIWDLDKYLSGELSLEEALRRCDAGEDEQPPRPEPVVIPDDRYPSRAQVLHAVRGLLEEEARQTVANDAHFGDIDPGPVYWLEEVLREHRRVLLKRTQPDVVRAEEARGRAAFEAFADKDAERAKASKAKLLEAMERKKRGE